jgi:pimeloyl-ACP methyl ester carboxylesterase
VNNFARRGDAPAPIVERRLRLDGVATRTLEVEGEGATVLLLHGFSDSADSFRPLLAELSRAGRHAVAVDLPGFGKADALGRPALDCMDGFVAEFVRRYAAAGAVVLVGHSMGGLLTLRAASGGGLPLSAVAGLGPGGLAYHRRLESLTRWVTCLGPVLAVVDWLPVPSALVRWAARSLYDRRLAMGRADPELGIFYASHVGTMRRLGQTFRNLIAVTQAETVLDAETLSRIEVPVLLIWGDEDHLADLSGAPTLLQAVPDSRLVVFEKCGHCPQVEAPGRVADLVAGLPATARPVADREAADATRSSESAS